MGCVGEGFFSFVVVVCFFFVVLVLEVLVFVIGFKSWLVLWWVFV